MCLWNDSIFVLQWQFQAPSGAWRCALENSFHCVATTFSVQSSRYFVVRALAAWSLHKRQRVQLRLQAVSHYRDVTPLPISFTVNNQEATPWYCDHNCDCVCGQAKSETENCLETRCPAIILIVEQKACCFPFGTFQPIAPGHDDINKLGPGLPFTSKLGDRFSLFSRGTCVFGIRDTLRLKKEQSWFRVY